MKRILRILLLVSLAICAFAMSVSAKHQYGTSLTDSNVEDQNYSIYAFPIYSYLETVDSGNLMTVSVSNYTSGVNIEVDYYTPQYALYKSVSLQPELPIFGGFYATESNYYILSGQTNFEESPNTEVYRVTKYDKNWNRLGSASLYGSNTTVPFGAGSARFAYVGNTLVVRTCHKMYTSSDGLNHQANVTFSVNTSNMSVITSWHVVANINWGGYVSHSFNQFIQYDGNQLVGVDHGDAYPRSICLIKYGTSAFLTDNVGVNNTYDLLDIPGAIGENYTGVSVGGFECSNSTYIVVGNSEINSANDVRNIFVATLPRNGSSTKITYLTSYTAYGDSVSTPHLVKISNDKFMVLWSRKGEIYYTILNAQGEKVGSIQKTAGALSDCVPTVVGGKVMWYTYTDNDVTFYSINTNTMSATKTAVNHGHTYVQKSDGNYHWMGCSECDKVIEKAVHRNTADQTRREFNENGDFVTVCKECGYVFKTEKVTYSVDAEGLGPILTTSSGTLKPDDDYDYYRSSWSQCYIDGKYMLQNVTFCIYGPDIFSQSVYKTFLSLPANSGVENIAAQLYTGKAIKPKVKVVSYGKTLKEGTDYTLTYKNNTKVGTATVTITGKGGYFGTVTKTFEIKDSIASATVSGIKNKIYTGKELTQSVKVVYKGKTLKQGVDYTVSYKNNKKLGTATVKITGCGKYAGTITKTFTIKLSTPKVTISTASTGVKVSWKKIAGAKTYTVYRSIYSGGKWSKWETVKTKVTGTSYTDKSVKSGAKVKYAVRAVNGSNKSSYKESNELRFLATPKVTIAAAEKGVKVSWKKISGAKTYTVYRSTYSNGKWGKWKAVKSKITGTSYTDKSVKSGAKVKYMVKAVNGKVTSAYKASNTIKFLKPPAVKVAKVSSGIKATWKKITGAKGYVVYRRTYSKGKWGKWVKVKTTTALNYTDKTAKKGVYYQYKVCAYYGDYKSTYTTTGKIKR